MSRAHLTGPALPSSMRLARGGNKDMTNPDFARTLSLLRQEKGISQRQAAKALGISVPELLSGEQVVNANRAANLLRAPFYVCPVCGNVIHASGAAVVSCCGVALPPLDAEEPDEAHRLVRESFDGEYVFSIPHEMRKNHYISFLACVTTGRFDLVKLYPEGLSEARFEPRGGGRIYWYCNRHGLFCEKV